MRIIDTSVVLLGANGWATIFLVAEGRIQRGPNQDLTHEIVAIHGRETSKARAIVSCPKNV
jgi:hypothetical protein